LRNGYVVVVEKEYKNSPDDMETINIWAEMSSKATNAQRVAAPDIDVQNAILSTDVAKVLKEIEPAIEGYEKARVFTVGIKSRRRSDRGYSRDGGRCGGGRSAIP
jgi:hypothetical protein